MNKKIKNNKLKKIIFIAITSLTIHSGFSWAQEVKSALKPCITVDGIKSYNNCFDLKIFENGSAYHGEFKDGRFNGQGEFIYPKGNNLKKYTGEFRDGKQNGQGTVTFTDGGVYVGEFKDNKFNGQGTLTGPDGSKYSGAFIDNRFNGIGTLIFADGEIYIGEFKNGNKHGYGIYTKTDGTKVEGVFENNDFKGPFLAKDLYLDTSIPTKNAKTDLKQEHKQSSDEPKLLKDDKQTKKQARKKQRLTLIVSNTKPNINGEFTIDIKTNSDTASLKINDEEQGGKQDGVYSINKVARAGQETLFNIVAVDINGNTESKSITVVRPITTINQTKHAELNPTLIKSQPSKDAVAIIIGIQNYKRVSKAEFANNDAQLFYDYAIRALGIKPDNIKLLVDEQADEAEILAAFQNWLPVKVRNQKTEVYVFYSGHGLPSDDGTSLYILPYGADKNFISKTAINQQEIIEALQSAQPKSVTMFMDACYSGQIRTGENLITDARPIKTKPNVWTFPPDFTVITASQSDQIASSSADFKHGIFSYYLMKGMEGDADGNKDNKITAGEMQIYLQDMVSRKAMHVNRKQVPQLIGDANKVLVGK